MTASLLESVDTLDDTRRCRIEDFMDTARTRPLSCEVYDPRGVFAPQADILASITTESTSTQLHIMLLDVLALDVAHLLWLMPEAALDNQTAITKVLASINTGTDYCKVTNDTINAVTDNRVPDADAASALVEHTVATIVMLLDC